MNNNRTPRRHLFSPEWLILSLLLVGLTLSLDYSGSLWRWDQLLYDSQVETWKRQAPDDIVVVAIDSKSLSAIGRWPWSRNIHADVVRRLTDAGARAILLDILFAEPDLRDPQGDQRLAEEIKRSGRVFLSLIVEHLDHGKEIVETLPIPQLAREAAAIGHVDLDLDQDGIARRVFLREGIGEPYWYSLGAALLREIDPDRYRVLPGTRNPVSRSNSGRNIVRDHHILLPFAGPPGHFQRISFIDVLEGNFDAGAFRDKLVVVGATATGLGDYYPTPVSGHSQPMPGVEIHANLIDALRQGITINMLSPQWQMPISAVLLLSALLLFPQLRPIFGVLMVVGAFFSILLLSAVLLQLFRVWFPPTSILLGLVLGYPLWSWRRLENAARYFEQELQRLDEEPRGPSFYGESIEISRGLQFLRHVVSIDGWRVLDGKGRVLSREGRMPTASPQQGVGKGYIRKKDEIWVTVLRNGGVWKIGVAMDRSEPAPVNAKQLIFEFLEQFGSSPNPGRKGVGGHELVEHQIRKIQAAISSLRQMRSLLSDTLTQMVDGLLVVNLGGQVIMANARAASLLGVPSESQLMEGGVDLLMEKFEVSGTLDWNDLFKRVLIDGKIERLEGRLPRGKEVLMQVSPMSVTQEKFHGMMFVLSDISLVKQSEYKRASALRFLSHDFRSPVNSVLSLVHMQKQNSRYFTSEETFERIEHYANRALSLANDFLRLVRAESVDEANFEDADFVTIVHNAADEVYTEAQKKKIRIVRRIDVEEAWIRADPSLVERALTNLLANSIRYSPEGSSVELELKVGGNEAHCCIRDRGRGIAESDLQRIFEPFQRVSEAGKQSEEGVGLGLTFVKTVAERHHGSVTVESQLGKGSRFCFVVPYDIAESENQEFASE